MPSASLLAAWRPEALGAAGRVLLTCAEELSLVGLLCAGEVEWVGPGSVEQRLAGERLNRQAALLGGALRDLGGVLARCASDLTEAQADLAAARWLAAASGWSLDDEGVPRPPAAVGHATAAPPREPAGARERARAALERAESADRVAARAVDSALLAVADPARTSTPWAPGMPRRCGLVAPVRPAPSEPDDVAAWWGALDDERRLAALRGGVPSLGSRDGVPAEVRDLANRRALREAMAAHPSPARRAMLAAVERAISAPGRRLALLDVGQARAAVAVGDLDSAEHVAVLVPGMSTDVTGDLGSLVANADRVRSVAAQLSGTGEEVAALAWLGYITPTLTTVASERRAGVGALQLAPVMRGIRARNPRAHLTLVGHSYGSLTVGFAVQQGAPADDVVLVGSPGAGVARSRDLGLSASHVLVGEAPGDAVARLERFGPRPGGTWFGASRLPTGPGTDPRTGERLRASHGHSDYYSAGTTSLRAIAGVVAGVGPGSG